ncbi:MAG: globin [Campylobacterales bacterium]|nr:globin [Campylobacterales bacterium]
MKPEEHQSCQSGMPKMFTQMSEQKPTPMTNRFGGEEVRVVDAMIDFIYPEVPFPSKRIFEALGEERIRALVVYHHDLLRKTKVGDLFPANDEAFKAAVHKSADFFVEALGGGATFTSVHGEPHLRSRHFKVSIDENARDIWLLMFKKALKEQHFPKAHLQEFWEWIEALSIRMINRRTTMEPICRYYWSEIKGEFEA